MSPGMALLAVAAAAGAFAMKLPQDPAAAALYTHAAAIRWTSMLHFGPLQGPNTLSSTMGCRTLLDAASPYKTCRLL